MASVQPTLPDSRYLATLLSEQEEDIAQLNIDLHEAREQIAQLAMQIMDREASLFALQDEVERLQGRLGAADQLARERLEKINAMAKEALAASAREIARLAELDRMDKLTAEQRGEIARLRTQLIREREARTRDIENAVLEQRKAIELRSDREKRLQAAYSSLECLQLEYQTASLVPIGGGLAAMGLLGGPIGLALGALTMTLAHDETPKIRELKRQVAQLQQEIYALHDALGQPRPNPSVFQLKS